MAEMRAFEPADLPAVAELLEANLPPWTSAQEGVSGSLADTYLGDPWSDPELPSLVAADENGKAIGFIGAQVKRIRLDDRTLRGVCISHLTVDPQQRGGATGALLLRRLLTQGQDFTYSDTANDEVVRMWHAFGGHLDHARAFDWMVVLKPVSWLGTLGTDTVLRRDLGRGQIPVGALPFQAARPRSGRWTFPEPDPGVISEDVGTAEIVEHLPEMAREFRLWIDYDEEFLDHVFDRMDSHFGRLVRRLVRRDERPLGWYAYVPKRRGVSRVLHLMTGDADADAVLGDLVAHARGEKTAVLTGRHEPHLTLALQRRLPVLGFARRPVVHSHDPEIYAALASRSSILTQLDGEWFIT
jgi:GNAT superfamily N-acetyltransferase